MIKLYRFLTLHITIILVLIVLQSGAQNLSIAQPSHIVNSISKKGPQQKALGDTLYYEDFSDQTLSNWTVIDSTYLGHNWIWSTTAPGGQYSSTIGPLNSPTASNGFICLPSDFYNTPWPSTGPLAMDAWISSKAIPIAPKSAVELSYRQFLRYCCAGQKFIEIQVSSDSLNWTAFDASFGLGPSTMLPNGYHVKFDVSSVLGGKDTAYIRFRQTVASHYFWMVDDLTLTEGLSNALCLDSAVFDPFSLSNSKLNYSIVPIGFGCSKSFNAIAKNIGVYTQRNIRMKAMVYMDSAIGGGPGQGVTNIFYSDTNTILPAERKEIEIVNNAFYNSGHYKAILSLESDSILQNLALAKDTIYFSVIADTVIARDYGQFNSSLGPKLYGAGHNRDKIGILLEAQDSSIISRSLSVNSLSVYVSSDTNNIGVSISPRIWTYNGTSIDSIPIGGSPFSIQIQMHMLNSWLTIPIFPPITLPPSELLVGLEQTANVTANSGFSLGVDAIGSQLAREAPTFISSHNLSASWATHPGLVGIRLNLNSLSYPCSTTVGIEEEESNSNTTLVYPNPTKGLINIHANPSSYQLEVRDINGRQVYSNVLQEGQSSIDLSYLQNGLYFLHFKGEEVKKLLIQK